MKLCRHKKVDLILVKSFSRLGRNTLNMLRTLREPRDLGVDVYFEEENLWLHDERMEMLVTVFCAFAQSESENISQNIRWGVRDRDSERELPAMRILCAMDTSEATMVGWRLTRQMPRSSAGYSKCEQKIKALVRYLTGSMIGRSSHPYVRSVGAGKPSTSCFGMKSIPGMYCFKRLL